MFFRPHLVQSMIAQIQTIREALVKWCYPKKQQQKTPIRLGDEESGIFT